MRPNPISPFLFHLYKTSGCLSEEEEHAYDAALVMEKFDVPEAGNASDSDTDSDPGSDLLESIPAPAAPTPARNRKRKETSRATGTPPSRKKLSRKVSTEDEARAKAETRDAFEATEDSVARAKEGYKWMETLMEEACRAAG